MSGFLLVSILFLAVLAMYAVGRVAEAKREERQKGSDQ